MERTAIGREHKRIVSDAARVKADIYYRAYAAARSAGASESDARRRAKQAMAEDSDERLKRAFAQMDALIDRVRRMADR